MISKDTLPSPPKRVVREVKALLRSTRRPDAAPEDKGPIKNIVARRSGILSCVRYGMNKTAFRQSNGHGNDFRVGVTWANIISSPTNEFLNSDGAEGNHCG